MATRKNKNIVLYLALAAGGIGLYMYMKNKSAAAASQAATPPANTLPGDPVPPLLATASTASLAPTDTESKRNYLLHTWVGNNPNPGYPAMINSLNPADIDGLYTLVSVYFMNNAPVPPNLQALWDRIAKPFGVY